MLLNTQLKYITFNTLNFECKLTLANETTNLLAVLRGSEMCTDKNFLKLGM